jgi:hypothetical protein
LQKKKKKKNEEEEEEVFGNKSIFAYYSFFVGFFKQLV